MRNVLLFLIIPFLGIAQNGYELTQDQYIAIQHRLVKSDTIEARAFASSIAGTAATPHQHIRTKVSDNGTVKYYYGRLDLTQKEQKDQQDFGCVRCMIVYFRSVNNSLQFYKVSGSLEDLQPTWQREFLPTATMEMINESFKYREIKNKEIGTDVRLQQNGDTWTIYNWGI